MKLLKVFSLTVALALLAPPLAAEAQQAARIPRIGYVTARGPIPSDEAFRQGLHDLGYVEGKNIAIEARHAEGHYDRLSDLVAELVRLKVDVIVTLGTPATRAAKQGTRTVPIVAVATSDLVADGLVSSLARPGGNITGLAMLLPELSTKQLELLKEVVPRLARVAVLTNPTNPATASVVQQMAAAAQVLRVQLHLTEVRDPAELDRAFSGMRGERAGAVIVLPDPMLISQRTRIVTLAARSRLPTMYTWREDVDAGGLMSYGPMAQEMFRRAAAFVDKILKGAKPADLPVEQPMRFELVINMKTAKALGLTFPQSILIRADQVIQ